MHCLGHARLAVVLGLAMAAGCRLDDSAPAVIAAAPPPPVGRFEPAAGNAEPLEKTGRVDGPLQRVVVIPAAHQQPQATDHQPELLPSPSDRPDVSTAPGVADDSDLAIAGEVLTLEQLVAEVEARNPSLQAMLAAWQAAAQKYPQAIALDDPMFMAMLAPGALGERDVIGGQQLQVTQRFPWPGKRRARGEMALSEADAAYHEAEDFRVQLRLMAQMAYYDYYLVLQNQRLNRENIEIMERFRETAQVRYQSNLVTQQDVLQADVESFELERRRLELNRAERVALARLNTLLRRRPDAQLPPLPPLPQPSAPQEDAALAVEIALAQRQDLAALAHRIEAEEASLALAHKQFYPDVDLIGAYNAMMPEKEMWGQVGVGLNIPLYRRKLNAAVEEAQFKVSQRVAEYEQKQLDIQYEVQAASERLEESRQTADLYRQKLVPTARQNVESTRANYENGKATFLDIALAQRQLVDLQEKEQDAIVSYHQRQAELARSLGGR